MNFFYKKNLTFKPCFLYKKIFRVKFMRLSKIIFIFLKKRICVGLEKYDFIPSESGQQDRIVRYKQKSIKSFRIFLLPRIVYKNQESWDLSWDSTQYASKDYLFDQFNKCNIRLIAFALQKCIFLFEFIYGFFHLAKKYKKAESSVALT